jgi:signal transduction histidine kinase/CheY-like chemotaxis protein
LPDALLISRHGVETPVQYRTTLIRDDMGRNLGVAFVLRDVTQQRKSEHELLRSQKLESLGLMAGGVAHDFNNLLSAIINNIGLLKRQFGAVEEVHRRLEFIERAAWRGTELTQQLLTFARGGAPVKKLSVIDMIVQEAANLALSGSASSLSWHVAHPLWSVEADPGQLGQAFHNLFVNASEAMPQGGVVKVRMENRVFDNDLHLALKPGPYVQISIQDHGTGIATENLTKIFDPYFTTKPRGNGLGLATTYSIINRHDGHIAVESVQGAGTTFTIYLPASHQAASAPVALLSAAKPPPGRGRILIMDDEELIREATGALLEHLGYTYEAAKDGAEAVDLYRHALQTGEPFDAVILDLTVPGGTGGRESIKQLLAIDPQVKAIVSSGYFHDPIAANYKAHGFHGVVSKPYTIEEMGETLHRLIHFDS